MATLTVRTTNRTSGISLTDVAETPAAGGDVFANTGVEKFWIKNGGGSSMTVTATVQRTVDGLSVTSSAITVAAGKELILGPYPTSDYNNTSGNVALTYSAVTSVSVVVFKDTTS